jgi:hypothetical protein
MASKLKMKTPKIYKILKDPNDEHFFCILMEDLVIENKVLD